MQCFGPMRQRLSALSLAVAATALLAAPAAASPVATSDDEYATLGRVFPDPMAGCQNTGTTPCSPNAQGNVPAGQFIGVDEFVRGLAYMNSKPEWQRYLEVWPLDGRRDGDDGEPRSGGDPRAAFEGNSLDFFEFTPREGYRSAGLPTTGNGRRTSDIYVVRVTDENVPDEQKKRYAVSLSIHGIERAGVEGGTRAAEDLVTAFTTGKADKPVVPDGTVASAPTFADVLRKAIVYFIYPNPDGWRRGSVSSGGVSFQRYNGNGVDLNRDWPDVGFAFRPYSALSEPESRSLSNVFKEIGQRPGGIAAGTDLHGQLTADALSYTLLAHGRHDWAKNTRILETAKAIHRVSEKALAWSAIVAPNDTPRSQLGCADAAGQATACARIYGQTWGTVYDTINYTTTGAMADWLDSPVGLNVDGIDNEMSFSHLDRNIVFDPQGEQLHVDGNKALIYAQLSQILNPPAAEFDAPGRKGYVAAPRVRRQEADLQERPPEGTVAQARIEGQQGSPGPGGVVFGFPVKIGRQPDGGADGGKDVFNGGLRVDVTKLNAAGISDGNAQTTLKVQCKGCDDHPGIDPDADGFITVAEDFNQSPAYAQGGLTAAVNRPMARIREGQAVQWRALLESSVPTLIDAGARMDVEFTQGPATANRETSGFNPPRLAGYDVANTDVFEDLNRSISDPSRRFERIDPSRPRALDRYTSIVLADDVPLPDAFRDALQGWVRDGGNLVLTDASLRLLREFVDLPAKSIADRRQYVGQLSFSLADGQEDAGAIRDPLLTAPISIVQDGARFNGGLRRQTYEPTPLGFAIQHTESTDENAIGDDRAASPAWDVDRQAFERAGGRTAAVAVEGGPSGTDPERGRSAVGEAAVGNGRVRFVGALLPQPSEAFDHDFGLEAYALTYTGHILLRNALEWPARGGAAGQGAGGTRTCPPRSGFSSVSARGTGRRRARIAFRRRVRQPITVDVFRQSAGRRVIGERLVARFRGVFRSFTWNGRATRRGRTVGDGVYVVRYRMPLGGGYVDTRRVVLRRSGGRFTRRRAYYRRESCGLLASFKLLRPVFGGTGNRPLRVAYRVSKTARVRLEVLRGRRVVARRRTATRRPGRTYRVRFGAARRSRGDHRVRITVAPRRGRAVRAVLTSRRL